MAVVLLLLEIIPVTVVLLVAQLVRVDQEGREGRARHLGDHAERELRVHGGVEPGEVRENRHEGRARRFIFVL